MSGAEEPRDRRHGGGPRLEPSWAPDAFIETVDLPTTTPVGRGRPADRALRIATLLAVATLGLALAKPWDWGTSTKLPPRPGAAAEATPTPPPGAAAASVDAAGRPTPRPRAWTDLGARLSCLSDRLWMVVVDEAGDDARAVARSWTRIEPVPASGPTDPGIATAHAYAEAVPRIGFCAPTRAGDAGPSADAGTRLEVAVWRVERAAGPQAASAVPLDLAVDAGGTFGDGGALYAPPAGTSGGRGSGDEAAGANGDDASSPAAGAGPGDPEAAWSIDGAAPWRPAGWSTGPTLAEVGGWPPGTYVFRVDLAGTEPGGGAEGWLAVELRGPWLGPDAAAPPSDRDGRTPDPGPAAAPAAPSSRP